MSLINAKNNPPQTAAPRKCKIAANCATASDLTMYMGIGVIAIIIAIAIVGLLMLRKKP
ncbi:MAG: hypothetical protein ABSF44_12965 [Candidatus Bathyarchaeia archaeon]